MSNSENLQPEPVERQSSRSEAVRRGGMRVVKGLAGLALISEAALIGHSTVEALSRDVNEEPVGLYFAEKLHPELHDNEEAQYSTYEVMNGVALNVLAIGGLAGVGVRLTVRAMNPVQYDSV